MSGIAARNYFICYLLLSFWELFDLPSYFAEITVFKRSIVHYINKS